MSGISASPEIRAVFYILLPFVVVTALGLLLFWYDRDFDLEELRRRMSHLSPSLAKFGVTVEIQTEYDAHWAQIYKKSVSSNMNYF